MGTFFTDGDYRVRSLIITGEAARKAICRHVLSAPIGHVVKISEPTRSLDANSKLWAMLTDLENQCNWHGVKLTAAEWKDLLSAGLVKSKVVPNIDGSGFVILGQRTSKMTTKQFSELLDLVGLFGDSRGVKWGVISDDA